MLEIASLFDWRNLNSTGKLRYSRRLTSLSLSLSLSLRLGLVAENFDIAHGIVKSQVNFAMTEMPNCQCQIFGWSTLHFKIPFNAHYSAKVERTPLQRRTGHHIPLNFHKHVGTGPSSNLPKAGYLVMAMLQWQDVKDYVQPEVIITKNIERLSWIFGTEISFEIISK